VFIIYRFMNEKQILELSLVERLFETLGYKNVPLRPSDRPDVIAELFGHDIGIEVTTFHSDEKEKNKGSFLRAEEAKKAKESGGGPYFIWGGVPDPMPALRVRIEDKVRLATQYDNTKYDDLLLLVAGQLPMLEAVASTFVLPLSLNIDLLNQSFHKILSESPFSAVYIHLIMQQVIYRWTPSTLWQLIKEQRY